MSELELMKTMNDSQRSLFQYEMNKVRKNKTTALVLTVFLGGIGAQHYYMGKIGLGIVCTLFCWTWIPLICSIFQAFTIMGTVERYNDRFSQEIADRIK